MNEDLTLSPTPIWRSSHPEVERVNCPDCGSPLLARFAYIPGQTYVPLGILDHAENFPPEIHCHHDSRLSWLHIDDDLPRESNSARTALLSSGAARDKDGA